MFNLDKNRHKKQLFPKKIGNFLFENLQFSTKENFSKSILLWKNDYLRMFIFITTIHIIPDNSLIVNTEASINLH